MLPTFHAQVVHNMVCCYVQVTDYYLLLAMAGMMSMGELSELESDQALRDHGIAELLHSTIQGSKGAIEVMAKFDPDLYPDLSHHKPQTLLSLVWPQYLQELAVSQLPITQVGFIAGGSLAAEG